MTGDLENACFGFFCGTDIDCFSFCNISSYKRWGSKPSLITNLKYLFCCFWLDFCDARNLRDIRFYKPTKTDGKRLWMQQNY